MDRIVYMREFHNEELWCCLEQKKGLTELVFSKDKASAEIFHLETVSKIKQVAIITFNNVCLDSVNQTQVTSDNTPNADEATVCELFELIPYKGNQFFIRGMQGGFMRVRTTEKVSGCFHGRKNGISLEGRELTSDVIFQIIKLKNGRVAIKAPNNKYLSINDSELVATSNKILPSGTFKLNYYKPIDTVTIKSSSGKYVTSRFKKITLSDSIPEDSSHIFQQHVFEHSNARIRKIPGHENFPLAKEGKSYSFKTIDGYHLQIDSISYDYGIELIDAPSKKKKLKPPSSSVSRVNRNRNLTSYVPSEQRSHPSSPPRISATIEQPPQDLLSLSFYKQRKAAKKALRNASEQLFVTDDQQRLFYCNRACQAQLENMMYAISSLSTGLIARNPSWKDDFDNVSMIMTDHIVGSALELIFAGVPIVSRFFVLPMQLAKLKREASRSKKKEREFLNGASLWGGGRKERTLLNDSLAFAFVYSRQNQIKMCTREGAEQLGKEWVNELVYNILKSSHSGDPANLSSALEKLQQQGVLLPLYGSKIKLSDGYQAKYTSLRNKAGISYLENGRKKKVEVLEQDCSRYSNSERYGHLHFPSRKSALSYIRSIGKKLSYGRK